MIDLATVVLCGVFVVFVIGPLILAGILVDGSQTNVMRWKDDGGVRAVVGTVLGTWVGLVACLQMSNYPRVGFDTLLIVFVATAAFGGFIARYGTSVRFERRAMTKPTVPGPLDLLQPAAPQEV